MASSILVKIFFYDESSSMSRNSVITHVDVENNGVSLPTVITKGQMETVLEYLNENFIVQLYDLKEIRIFDLSSNPLNESNKVRLLAKYGNFVTTLSSIPMNQVEDLYGKAQELFKLLQIVSPFVHYLVFSYYYFNVQFRRVVSMNFPSLKTIGISTAGNEIEEQEPSSSNFVQFLKYLMKSERVQRIQNLPINWFDRNLINTGLTEDEVKTKISSVLMDEPKPNQGNPIGDLDSIKDFAFHNKDPQLQHLTVNGVSTDDYPSCQLYCMRISILIIKNKNSLTDLKFNFNAAESGLIGGMLLGCKSLKSLEINLCDGSGDIFRSGRDPHLVVPKIKSFSTNACNDDMLNKLWNLENFSSNKMEPLQSVRKLIIAFQMSASLIPKLSMIFPLITTLKLKFENHPTGSTGLPYFASGLITQFPSLKRLMVIVTECNHLPSIPRDFSGFLKRIKGLQELHFELKNSIDQIPDRTTLPWLSSFRTAMKECNIKVTVGLDDLVNSDAMLCKYEKNTRPDFVCSGGGGKRESNSAVPHAIR